MLEIKNYEFKDLDIKDRTVKGYFSVFDNVDSDNDIIRKGAYARTLNGNKGRIAHLFMHNPMMPIGAIKELKEDGYGLYFESKLTDTALGNDVLKMYRDEIIKEHSVGFQTLQENELKDGTREITEIKLWEGSSVVWGANQLAQVVKTFGFDYIKSETNILETLKSQIEELNNSLSQIRTDAPATKKPDEVDLLNLYKSL